VVILSQTKKEGVVFIIVTAIVGLFYITGQTEIATIISLGFLGFSAVIKLTGISIKK